MPVDEYPPEVNKKIKNAIKAKLNELGAYVDDELPDYIMILVGIRKSKEQMDNDLSLFLGQNTESFTSWLHSVLEKIDEAARLQSVKTANTTVPVEAGDVTPVMLPPGVVIDKKKHKKKKDKSEKKNKDKKEKKKKKDKDKDKDKLKADKKEKKEAKKREKAAKKASEEKENVKKVKLKEKKEVKKEKFVETNVVKSKLKNKEDSSEEEDDNSDDVYLVPVAEEKIVISDDDKSDESGAIESPTKKKKATKIIKTSENDDESTEPAKKRTKTIVNDVQPRKTIKRIMRTVENDVEPPKKLSKTIENDVESAEKVAKITKTIENEVEQPKDLTKTIENETEPTEKVKKITKTIENNIEPSKKVKKITKTIENETESSPETDTELDNKEQSAELEETEKAEKIEPTNIKIVISNTKAQKKSESGEDDKNSSSDEEAESGKEEDEENEQMKSTVHERLGPKQSSPPRPQKRLINLKEEASYRDKDGMTRAFASALKSAVVKTVGENGVVKARKLEARVKPYRSNERSEDVPRSSTKVIKRPHSDEEYVPTKRSMESHITKRAIKRIMSDDNSDLEEIVPKRFAGSISSKVETRSKRLAGASKANSALILRAVADAEKSIAEKEVRKFADDERTERARSPNSPDKRGEKPIQIFTRSYQERNKIFVEPREEKFPSKTKRKTKETQYVIDSDEENETVEQEEYVVRQPTRRIVQEPVKVVKKLRPVAKTAKNLVLVNPEDRTRFVVTMEGMNEIATVGNTARILSRTPSNSNIDEEEYFEEVEEGVEEWEEYIEENGAPPPQVLRGLQAFAQPPPHLGGLKSQFSRPPPPLGLKSQYSHPPPPIMGLKSHFRGAQPHLGTTGYVPTQSIGSVVSQSEENMGVAQENLIIQTIPTNTTLDNKKTNKLETTLVNVKNETCRFWPNCKEGKSCQYQHPKVPCNTFPNCRFGDKCVYQHPKCKFDSTCAKPSCPFSHTGPRNVQPIKIPPTQALTFTAKNVVSAKPKIKCKFFPSCKDMNCPFLHPTQMCRFNTICKLPNCNYIHPEVSTGLQLKWKAPAVSTKSSISDEVPVVSGDSAIIPGEAPVKSGKVPLISDKIPLNSAEASVTTVKKVKNGDSIKAPEKIGVEIGSCTEENLPSTGTGKNGENLPSIGKNEKSVLSTAQNESTSVTVKDKDDAPSAAEEKEIPSSAGDKEITSNTGETETISSTGETGVEPQTKETVASSTGEVISSSGEATPDTPETGEIVEPYAGDSNLLENEESNRTDDIDSSLIAFVQDEEVPDEE